MQVVIDSLEPVEDTKGNNGESGTLQVTNLRMIWMATENFRTNLSVGYGSAIRPTTANDAFDPALWETIVSTTLGLDVPTLAALPSPHNNPLAKCGCKKFCMDLHGDHTSTCTRPQHRP